MKYLIQLEARISVRQECELSKEQFEILNESEDQDEIMEVLEEIGIDFLDGDIDEPEINTLKKLN